MTKNQSKRRSTRKRKYPKYLNKPGNSPYFHYCFVVEPNGKPERGSTNLVDVNEAKAFVDNLREVMLAKRKLRTVAQNEHGKTVDMPLLLAIDRYKAEKEGTIKRPDNVRRYCDIILEIIDPATPVSKIDTALASDFVTKLRKRQVKCRGGWRNIASSHAKSIVSTLSSILEEVHETWKVPLPNSPNFSRFKFARTSRKRYFSADEMVRTETELTTAYALVYYFLLLTGLRLRNGVELTWGQVDWENLKIKVLAKGDVEQEVEITPLVGAILRTQEQLHPPIKRSDPVFVSIARGVIMDGNGNCVVKRGEAYPMKGNAFYHALKAACGRADVPDARPHDLRRTCGTMTLRTTSDITIVQDRLGHRDVRVTRQSYAFVAREAVTEGARRTEEATTRQLEQARNRRAATGRVDVRRVTFEPTSNQDPGKRDNPLENYRVSEIFHPSARSMSHRLWLRHSSTASRVKCRKNNNKISIFSIWRAFPEDREIPWIRTHAVRSKRNSSNELRTHTGSKKCFCLLRHEWRVDVRRSAGTKRCA